jgi:Tol biopolymer transport system component
MMTMGERSPLNPSAADTNGEQPGRRLDSWKEIASWFNRSEKTVRRWEEREGMPVHRILHEKRGTVYAYSAELEAWRQSRKVNDTAPFEPDGIQSAQETPLEEVTPADQGQEDTLTSPETILGDYEARRLAQTAQKNRRATAIEPAVSVTFRIASLVVIGLAAICILVFFSNRRQSKTIRQANSAMRIVPLTSLPGEAYGPAFSPDGEKIAFLWNGENPVKYDLYVQLLGGEKPLRVTHTRGGYICCASWSPDGRKIAFGRCDDNGGAVFVIPALGGTELKLTDASCVGGSVGFPEWTADGSSIILVDRCMPEAPPGILKFSLKTGERRCLDSPAHGEVSDSRLILSPDQKTVAFLRETTYGADEIYTVAVAGGNLRRLTYDNAAIWGLMWASDGRRIIYESTRRGLSRLWQVPAAGGEVATESVYPGIGAISRDGKRLAYVVPSEVESFLPEVWRIEFSSAGGRVLSQKKIFDSSGLSGGVQLSPDGREIVFESSRSANTEIWKGNANAGDLRQLTSFEKWSAGTPRWAPDGKSIAFDVQIGAHTQIYLMDSESRNQRSVVSGSYDNSVPSWSRDGGSIYFASNRTGGWEIWTRRLETGQERQLTHHGGFTSFEAYSGKILYYSTFEGGGIWTVPVAGGEERRVTDGLHSGYYGHFAVTQDGLYFLDAEAEPAPTIMYYSFQSRRSTPVLVLKENPVDHSPSFGASRDGRTLFFAQAHFQRSIRMAENFQ